MLSKFLFLPDKYFTFQQTHFELQEFFGLLFIFFLEPVSNDAFEFEFKLLLQT